MFHIATFGIINVFVADAHRWQLEGGIIRLHLPAPRLPSG